VDLAAPPNSHSLHVPDSCRTGDGYDVEALAVGLAAVGEWAAGLLAAVLLALMHARWSDMLRVRSDWSYGFGDSKLP
jgi:hypothetical protein